MLRVLFTSHSFYTIQPSLLWEIFKRLHKAVLREKPEIWPTIKFSTIQMFQLIRRSLSSSFWFKSLLLKRNNFSLFPKIICALNGRTFDDIEDIGRKVMTTLRAIHQQVFQKCFEQCSIVGLST